MKSVFFILFFCLMCSDRLIADGVIDDEIVEMSEEESRPQPSCWQRLLCCCKSKEEKPLQGVLVNVEDELLSTDEYTMLMPYLKLPDNRDYHIPKARGDEHIKKALQAYQRRQVVPLRPLLESRGQLLHRGPIEEKIGLNHPYELLQKVDELVASQSQSSDHKPTIADKIGLNPNALLQKADELIESQSQPSGHKPTIEDKIGLNPDALLQTAADEISQLVVRHDIEFLNHRITEENAQKIVSTVILFVCSIGLAALNGYLGSSC